MDNTKVRRSGYPRDLREEGPCGEVKTHWQPEAFTWYGFEINRAGGHDEVFVHVSKSQFRVSQGAAEVSGIQPGDRVKVGVNSTFLAFRRDDWGIPARPDKSKTTRAFYLSATPLIKKLKEEGWPVPGRLPAMFDAESGMLVARKPVSSEGNKADGRG